MRHLLSTDRSFSRLFVAVPGVAVVILSGLMGGVPQVIEAVKLSTMPGLTMKLLMKMTG